MTSGKESSNTQFRKKLLKGNWFRDLDEARNKAT